MATATQRSGTTKTRRAASARSSGAKSRSTRSGTSAKASSNGSGGSAKAASNASSKRSAPRGSSRTSSQSSSRGTANGSRGGAGSARGKQRSSSRRPTATRTRGRAQTQNGAGGASGRANGNGSESLRERASETIGNGFDGIPDAAKQIGLSVATGTIGAAAGIAGGILLGRASTKRPRRILGVKVPRQQVDLGTVARGVNDAGKQFGKLAGEVRAAREKAEEIGKVLR